MSTLTIVILVVVVLLVLFFIGGLLGARSRDRAQAPVYARHLADADHALEQARAADRGWDRDAMEQVVRSALSDAHPGANFERLDLVLVDDRPGVHEDRAHFEARDGDRAVRVVLARGDAGWSADQVGWRVGPAGLLRAQELVHGFTPENGLERQVSEDPVLLDGLAWGEPREGHPEGSVGAHVADLLRTIDSWGEQGTRRSDLRFLSLVHDALKYRVKEWLPRIGENHHAMRARRFAEHYTDDERLLATLELHDKPYSIWRQERRTGKSHGHAMQEMLDRVPDRDLFLRFVELDGSTEGKRPEPIEWVRSALAERRGGD